MEVKKLSWLLRALLILIGLACLWRLRLELYDLRTGWLMLSDPYETSLYTRAFVCSLFLTSWRT